MRALDVIIDPEHTGFRCKCLRHKHSCKQYCCGVRISNPALMSNAKDADETFGVIYGQSKRTSCIDFAEFSMPVHV
jgi:hypothetical protein